MKDSIVIIFFAVGLIFNSCIFQNEKKNNKTENVDSNIKKTEEQESSPFISVLEDAIDEALDYLKLEYEINPDSILVHLHFDGKYLSIVGEDFYYKNQTKGYAYYNGHIVVLNGLRDGLGANFIDLDKLIPFTDTIPGFVDRFEKYRDWDIDPFGIKYKIIDNDSLVLEHKGML